MKIKFGAIVTDGRGKIGGHVASKNRGGAYLRTKVTPSNPNSVAQAQARSLLGSLSQAWRGLDPEQRLAWNAAVADWSTTDIFGDIKNPSGLNLFVKVNANLASVGLPMLFDVPAKLNTPATALVRAEYQSATGVISFLYTDSLAGGTMALVRATKSLSQGVSFVKSEYRVISHKIIIGDGFVLDGEYESKFGAIVDGDNIFISAQFVLPSGQKTVPQSVKLTYFP